MIKSVSTLLVLAVVPTSAHAQDTEWNRYTLEGLGGVHLEIAANPVCESAGASASSLQADATLLLIEGGVELLTLEQMLENIALPELKVTLECSEGGASALAYSVSLRVQQAAQMLRDTQVTLPEAVTWYSGDLGVVAGSDAAGALKGSVTEQLEAFVAAYTAANTSEGGSE